MVWRAPALQMYVRASDGGLGREHPYAMAAAATVDQVDRALCGGAGEAAGVLADNTRLWAGGFGHRSSEALGGRGELMWYT